MFYWLLLKQKAPHVYSAGPGESILAEFPEFRMGDAKLTPENGNSGPRIAAKPLSASAIVIDGPFAETKH